MKLKLTANDIVVFSYFCNHTCAELVNEIHKFMHKQKTLEYLELKVRLGEMLILKDKFDLLEYKKTHISRPVPINRKYLVKISPVHSLLIIMYSERYIKKMKDDYLTLTIQEQKDILYKSLLTN